MIASTLVWHGITHVGFLRACFLSTIDQEKAKMSYVASCMALAEPMHEEDFAEAEKAFHTLEPF